MHIILPLSENVNSAVDISAVPEDAFGKLMYGLNIALIGMGTVFAVLLILMAVLYVFKMAFAKKPVAKPAETSSPTVKTQPLTTSSQGPDDEYIPVVIAAAVATYMENTAPHSKYRIRSFKRI